MLGLITTKVARVETVDELRRRIDEAARYLPLNSWRSSPQCGFASSMRGNLLTEDEQFRKVDVMLETARRVRVKHLVQGFKSSRFNVGIPVVTEKR